jgi:hypothetical protein
MNFKYQDGSSPPANISITGQQNIVLLQGVAHLIGQGNVSFGMKDSLSGTEVLKMLYQPRNITESIHSLVHYINIALRSNHTILHSSEKGEEAAGGSATYITPSHRVKGTVYIVELHVAVRWAWLALPGLVALLTGLLLAFTMIESHSQRVGIWKDNPLALLLYSEWYPGPRQSNAPAITTEEIERDMKGLGAVLVHWEDEEKRVKEIIQVHQQ